MCTTRGDCRLISILCQKEFVESELNGQTDSRSDYSVHLRVVQNFFTKSLNIVFIDNFELHIFQFNIDFVIFGSFLRVRFSQRASSLVTVMQTNDWTMLKQISMQNLIQIYHMVQELWAFLLTDDNRLDRCSAKPRPSKKLLRMPVVRQCWHAYIWRFYGGPMMETFSEGIESNFYSINILENVSKICTRFHQSFCIVKYLNTLAGNKATSQYVIHCYIERTSVGRREKFDRNFEMNSISV